MTERDLDIDFDFFDEPETAETAEAQQVHAAREEAPARPGPPRPPTSLTPLLRLIGLIAFAIFLVVVLVFWVQSCQGASKHNGTAPTCSEVSVVGAQSARLGNTLNHQLDHPGIKLADLENDLNGLARQQQQLVDQAQGIRPPGAAAAHPPAHGRVAPVPRTAASPGSPQAFQREGSTKKIVPGAGKRIASQTQRFIASDVVWDDLFKTPAQRALAAAWRPRRAGARLELRPEPRSHQRAHDDRDPGAHPRRVDGQDAVGGSHGSGLESVKVTPGGQELSTTSETKVNVSTNLAFNVTVKNTGQSVETHIPVHLTIQQSSADQGNADDRPDRAGADEDARVHGQLRRPGHLRRAGDGEGRRRAGAGREESRQQQRRLQGHLLARAIAPPRDQAALGSSAMSLSSSAAAWIGIGAVCLAAVALGFAVWAWTRIASVRRQQLVLLGGGKGDLVEFAVSLQGRIDDLHRAVDEIAAGLSRVDRRVDASIQKSSIVRYDAYEGTGGNQSASLAVLDSSRTGVVVSAIQGRDYARIYMKELDRGRASVALSPEEAEAVERAMAT